MNVSAIAPDSRRFTWLSRLVLACAAFLLLALAFAPQQAHALTTTDGWGYTLLTEEEQGIEGMSIIDYVGDEADIAIPAEIDGVPVVDATIGNDAVRSIDATACYKLDSLTLQMGDVESLDVSGCSKLRWLSCSGNKLESLNLAGCTGLSTLHCDNNRLTELDISDCPNLSGLSCDYNYIVDTSALIAWSKTGVENYEILPQYDAETDFAYVVEDGEYGYGAYIQGWKGDGTSLSIPWHLGGVDVVSASITNKGLESIDVSECLSLKYLDCSFNVLDDIAYYDVQDWLEEEGHEGIIQPQIDATTGLSFEVRDGESGFGAYVTGYKGEAVETIEVPSSLRGQLVVSMDAHGLNCDLLDLRQCSDMRSLSLRYSRAHVIDASTMNSLESLTCGTSSVYALDLSFCDALKKLDCDYNNVASLNLADCSSLEELHCMNNRLTDLDVANCPNLKTLHCAGNLLDDETVARLSAEVPDAVVSPQADAATADGARLNATDLHLERTETFQLEACSYVDDTPMAVTWRSSNEAVASVGENGLVTAKALGDAAIVAENEEGWPYGACLVTVDFASSDSDVESISFDKERCNVDFVSKCPVCGKSHTGEGRAVVSFVSKGAEEVFSHPSVDFEYDENIIEDVQLAAEPDLPEKSEAVYITGKAIGTTKLTAYVENSDGSRVETTVEVVVSEATAPTFSMPSDRTYRRDQSVPVVTHYWAGGGEVVEPLVDLGFFPGMVTDLNYADDLHGYERYLKSVSSSDESVISFAEGAMLEPGESQPENVLDSHYLVMDFKKPGTSTITIEDIWGHKGTCEVTVVDASIDIDDTPLILKPGDKLDLMSRIKGGFYNPDIMKFVSSDESVASIKPRHNNETFADEHILTAKKNGSAEISVRFGMTDPDTGEWDYYEFGTIPVTVATPVESVALNETEKTVQVGDKPFALTATVSPAGASDTKVTWSSSNDKVAKVDAKGTVTPVAAGKVEITATVGGKSAKCVVMVKAKQVASTDSGSAVAGSVTISNSSSASDEKLMEKLEGLGLAIEPVKPAESEPVKQAVAAIVQAGGDVVEVLDIHFTDENGDEVAWSDEGHVLTVRIAMTDAMKELAKTQDLVVYYIDENGERTEMPTWIEGDELVFQTTHFSTYAVAGVPQRQPDDPDDPDDGNGGGNQGGNQGHGDNNQGDNGNGNGSGNDDSTDNNKGSAQGTDKTGDTASNGGTLAVMGDPLGVAVLAVAAAALAAVLALAFAARRRVR